MCNKWSYIFILSGLLVGCHSENKPAIDVNSFNDSYHTKGFSIADSGSYYHITVKNPWQNATNTYYYYNLNKDGSKTDNTIAVPVKKVVCLSTTHVGFISQLGETESIIGLSNPGLINNPEVQNSIANGLITDVGYDAALNFELLLQLKPDVVFAYSVGPEMAPLQAKLAEFGIPLIMVAEYLEENALAKAEWIKFFGCFYNKLPEATAFYQNEVHLYDSVKNSFQKKDQPVVMTGFPWKDVWYVPGNTSYMVQLIKDAGGKYLFEEVNGRESQPFAIEYISQKAVKSQIWINAGVAGKLTDITSGDTRLANINAFRENKVYNNNKRQTPEGGSDFFESGVVSPHLILKDLITIFNADSVSNDQLYYYQKLN